MSLYLNKNGKILIMVVSHVWVMDTDVLSCRIGALYGKHKYKDDPEMI